MPDDVKTHLVWIDYTNWRGQRSRRRIMPIRIEFGSTEYHPEPQWFVVAIDIEKTDERKFSMKDIHSWIAAGDTQ
jgi:hypothetical protein